MVCKGICVRHKAQKPSGAFGRYATGQKSLKRPAKTSASSNSNVLLNLITEEQ